MHVATVRVGSADDSAMEQLNDFLAAARMNGQVCGREFPIFEREERLLATVMLPEIDALDETHDNEYVARDRLRLQDGSGGVFVVVVGPSPTVDPCGCQASTSYVLFTTATLLESPLHCGDCFGPVALYRVPPTHQGEFWDVIGWQTEYQAFDALELGASFSQRWARKQMFDLASRTSREGLRICAAIGRSTGVPVYYYLYRWGARSLQQERARRCPGCGGEWLLPKPWHEKFDYRCDSCRLVSNVAWELRSAFWNRDKRRVTP